MKPPLDLHPQRFAMPRQDQDEEIWIPADVSGTLSKFIDINEGKLHCTNGVIDPDYANQLRVADISAAPRKTRSEAPPEYQQEGMPILMSYSKGCDDRKALIYTPGDPKAELQGAVPCAGIVRSSQGVITSDSLARYYAYVYFDLGFIYAPRGSDGRIRARHLSAPQRHRPPRRNWGALEGQDRGDLGRRG
eukprot:4752755-Pyramimonas_sp.AAC.2